MHSDIENAKQQSYGGGFFYSTHSTNSTSNGSHNNQQPKILYGLNVYTPLMNTTANYQRTVNISNKAKIRKNLTYLSDSNKAKYVQVTKPMSLSPMFKNSVLSYSKHDTSMSEFDKNNMPVAPPTPQSSMSK